MDNYYEILGISEDTSPEDMKSAYRDLAKKWHPDINKSPEASEKFKKVSEAYKVLSDENERKKYDFARQRGTDYSSNFDPSDFNFGDILKNFFGGDFQGMNMHQSNENIVEKITLTPQETLTGKKFNKNFSRKVYCDDCTGTGGHDFSTCGVCNGLGKRQEHVQRGGMIFQSNSTCQKCGGTGKVPKKTCSNCSGKGYTLKSENVSLDINSTMIGQTLSMPGKGHYVHTSAPPGDMIMQVLLTEGNGFRPLDGRGNVETDIEIDPVMAMLGGEISIKNLENTKLKVKIPKGVRENQKLEMKSQGMKNSSGNRGSLLLVMNYKIPKDITKSQEDVLKKYLDLRNYV